MRVVRITKVYTKTGDDGYTSLMDGKRYSKASPKFAAMGDIDTLNAQIGWCRQVLSAPLWQDMDQQCARIQQELFDVGAMLCVPPSQRRADTPVINKAMVEQLEHAPVLWEMLTDQLANLQLGRLPETRAFFKWPNKQSRHFHFS